VVLFACRRLTRHPWFADRALELEAGAIAVLRGPSGSGKTLFLRTLADLDPADGGEVLLDGRERASFAPAAWRRRVTYVHPAGVPLPGTVRQNLARVRALAGTEPAEPSDGAAELEGLDLDAPADRLSSGERQRLALARALAGGPRVLMPDEPTAQLDAARARATEERLARWVEGGRAVLWASHDARLAERLGARELHLP